MEIDNRMTKVATRWQHRFKAGLVLGKCEWIGTIKLPQSLMSRMSSAGTAVLL